MTKTPSSQYYNTMTEAHSQQHNSRMAHFSHNPTSQAGSKISTLIPADASRFPPPGSKTTQLVIRERPSRPQVRKTTTKPLPECELPQRLQSRNAIRKPLSKREILHRQQSRKAVTKPLPKGHWVDESTGLIFTKEDYVRSCEIELSTVRRMLEIVTRDRESFDKVDMIDVDNICLANVDGAWMDMEDLLTVYREALLEYRTRSERSPEEDQHIEFLESKINPVLAVHHGLSLVRRMFYRLRTRIETRRKFRRAGLPMPKRLEDACYLLEYLETR
ncbi:hypothetical protein BJ508DRAFT_321125 [Ascobolus immersus RN42]|uniref:Uncharacterized protein n=1 Tax=Ascobolus immersus RN42 TaxID=1160509 RepID=A0A3N4IM91_ASCIM|nr:hypothetical protein BJ508DRAFT_321125 [Ascobolus immersus RN42]